MGYKDGRKQWIKRSLNGNDYPDGPITSAMELYELGKSLYKDEQANRLDSRLGCPWWVTPFGDIALKAYFRGRPKMRLP